MPELEIEMLTNISSPVCRNLPETANPLQRIRWIGTGNLAAWMKLTPLLSGEIERNRIFAGRVRPIAIIQSLLCLTTALRYVRTTCHHRN